MVSQFTELVKSIIREIPAGRVMTYGSIAAAAGNPRAARQVVRILHSSSTAEDLPWHRVINSRGSISLPVGQGYELQKSMLENEGIEFDEHDRVDLQYFHWLPSRG
jgi:methylated-DNA-protein-cysteine methyltransferase-like protein